MIKKDIQYAVHPIWEEVYTREKKVRQFLVEEYVWLRNLI